MLSDKCHHVIHRQINDLYQLSLLPSILLISKRTVLCTGPGFGLFSMTTWNLFLASPKENSILQTWARGRRCESRNSRCSVWTFPHTLSFLSQQSPEASTEHTQCPLLPRASHRNCVVSLFSYLMCFIHSMCVSLISLQLRHQGLRNKTEALGLVWQRNFIFLGKSHMCTTTDKCAWPYITRDVYESTDTCQMFHPSSAHSNICWDSPMSLVWAKLVF